MRVAILLLVSCAVVGSKALECGIGRVNSDKVKETLSFCVKNNETLEKIWEMATAASKSSTESKEDSDVNSSEEAKPNKNMRKSRATGRVQGTMIQVTERRSSEDDANTTRTTEVSGEGDTTTSSTIDTPDNCIIQCIFKRLEMTDDNELPDHVKILEGLLKTTNSRELRVFLQESADECFQQMEQEKNADSCVYSSRLITCLADRGRMNCADWPAGNLPF